jgi:phosphotransferase system, enzyme I, PtsP
MTGAGSGAASRILLRRLRELMATGEAAQARLNRLVTMIAATMVADVCSIYLRRQDASMELCATEGLSADAVHTTRLKPGEGLVGLIAETAEALSLSDAPKHPKFSYRPETGEDPFQAFMGVPILRAGRTLGVLVVQNRSGRTYADDEIEAMQTIAMVLAEVVASGDMAESFSGVEIKPTHPERLSGKCFADGLAIGVAVLHDPDIAPTRLLADDPVLEERRLEEALASLRAGLEALISGEATSLQGASYEVLETFHLLAGDRGWERRLREAIRSGLSAEAAVERVRSEHRARLANAKDGYLRDRLQDLEELDNRLLRHLSGAADRPMRELPKDAVLVARNLGPAELLEYGPGRIRAILLEEGSSGSHAAIVAKALGVPMIGRLVGLVSRVVDGDAIIVDGPHALTYLRPEPGMLETYQQRLAIRQEEVAAFASLRDKPCKTLDGKAITLFMNAGLTLDMDQLAPTGADGVGLFRTEFQFMISDTLPRIDAQTRLYGDVLKAAAGKPVIFRTLDLGSDKVLPYMTAEREENPAMGWRALRIGLDRPGLLRYQLRALIRAAEGGPLSVMFPLVTDSSEFLRGREMVEREIEWSRARGRAGPSSVKVGAMVEAPALAWDAAEIAKHADFLSIGTNDLMQFFFAADRANPRVSDRYDVLSPAALTFLARIRNAGAAAGIPVSICGEAAGRPLEALALMAVGFDRLSMPPSGIGPVKRMALSLNVQEAAAFMTDLLQTRTLAVRPALLEFAKKQRILL